jgi:Rrf2 family iron-sulfur cluster assembly transcriptional regulator
MRLTTKGRFAVSAMVDLALQSQRAPVPLTSISERQKISLSYLEQLFSKLRRHDLVQSYRGPGGGYRLARERSDITIAQVIKAVDEVVDATNCKGKGGCKNKWPCISHKLWEGLNKAMLDYLETVTLEDLVSGRYSCHNEAVAHLQTSVN